MGKQGWMPRKQRTRQHVIADLSVHHTEGFILREGHTVLRVDQDYGYDLVIFTYDGNGYVEPGVMFVQLKASETLQTVGSDFVYDIEIRDYNLWMQQEDPVILILYEASRERAYWLPIQRYFHGDVARRPKKGTKTVRVRVPRRQLLTRQAVAKMRELKQSAFDEPTGDV